jgi:hypothetical protein
MKRFNSDRLAIESLERREMMAADAVMSNGTLMVTGTEQSDLIVVSQETQNGLLTVKVTVTDLTNGATLLQRSFMHGQVGRINVQALGGNDTVQNNTAKASTIFGGAGGDTLRGGSAGDLIYASTGPGSSDSGGNN